VHCRHGLIGPALMLRVQQVGKLTQFPGVVQPSCQKSAIEVEQYLVEIYLDSERNNKDHHFKWKLQPQLPISILRDARSNV